MLKTVPSAIDTRIKQSSMQAAPRKGGEKMTEKEMFEKTVEELKKLDREGVLIIKTGAEMLAAYRQVTKEKTA